LLYSDWCLFPSLAFEAVEALTKYQRSELARFIATTLVSSHTFAPVEWRYFSTPLCLLNSMISRRSILSKNFIAPEDRRGRAHR
jgi:hypothetical protein